MVPPPRVPLERVGRRPQAQIGGPFPVLHVVTAKVGCSTGEIRHFVVDKPLPFQDLRGGQEEGPLLLLVRGLEEAGLLHFPQGRSPAHGKLVAGNVIRRKGERFLEGPPPFRLGLAREAVDEVDPETGKPTRPDPLHGTGRLARRMRSAEEGEFPVVHGLHAEADPVETKLPEKVQFLQGHVIRVRLQGDLRVRAESEMPLKNLHKACQFVRGEQRRGAAAQVQGVEEGKPVLVQHGFLIEGVKPFGDQGGGRFQRSIGDRIEIAVPAFLPAEGDVNVEPCGIVCSCLHRGFISPRTEKRSQRPSAESRWSRPSSCVSCPSSVSPGASAFAKCHRHNTWPSRPSGRRESWSER